MERKALVGAIQKFSTEDGPGIRTTVFLKGCPLSCRWCHNPELISPRQQLILMPNSCIRCGHCLSHCPREAVFLDGGGRVDIDRGRCDLCMDCTEFCYARGIQAVAKPMSAGEVMAEVVQDRGFYDNTGGGMTVSGGELLMQPEFTAELVSLAAAAGIGVCLDTSGCGDGETLLSLARRENVAHVLFDMKSMDEGIHRAYTGRGNAGILNNLRLLASDASTRRKLWLRMPLIRGVNDSEAQTEAAAALCGELGIERATLLPYHDLGVSKMKNTGGVPERFQPPEDGRLEEIRARLAEFMDVEILGRVK